VTLEPRGEKLAVRPVSRLTPEELERLRQHKAEVLRLLSRPEPLRLDPVTSPRCSVPVPTRGRGGPGGGGAAVREVIGHLPGRGRIGPARSRTAPGRGSAAGRLAQSRPDRGAVGGPGARMTVAGRRDLRLDVAGAPLSRSLSVVGHEDVDFDDDELVGDGGAGGLHQDRESLDGGWIASARVMFINTSTAPLGGPPNGSAGSNPTGLDDGPGRAISLSAAHDRRRGDAPGRPAPACRRPAFCPEPGPSGAGVGSRREVGVDAVPQAAIALVILGPP
jgi:hypothetical protein